MRIHIDKDLINSNANKWIDNPGPAGPYWGPHLGAYSRLTAGTPCLVPAHHYHCHPLLEHAGEGLG